MGAGKLLCNSYRIFVASLVFTFVDVDAVIDTLLPPYQSHLLDSHSASAHRNVLASHLDLSLLNESRFDGDRPYFSMSVTFLDLARFTLSYSIDLLNVISILAQWSLLRRIHLFKR